MTYYVADLTAQDPDYERINDPYTWYQTGAKIVFPTTIYAKTVVVTTTDGTGTVLVEGTDYQFNPDDIDTTTTSRTKNGDLNFSDILVRSLTVTRNANLLPIKVVLGYQQFYLTTPNAPVASGSGSVDLTPDLIMDVLRRIAAIEQVDAMVPSVLSSTTATPMLLQYDINGDLAANVITGEIHTVNTFGTNKVIRPVQGSFFRDSVQLFNGTTPLIANTDYLVVNFNQGKTKLTTNVSGIYDLILVTAAYAGPLIIGYHAVGGEVSVADLAATYGQLKGVTDYLNSTGFLTADSLPDAVAIQSIYNNIKSLETTVRVLLAGNPTYGDVTNNITVPKQIRANDTNLHWYTVASLYKVAGSPTIVQADRISLHVQLSGANYLADIDVAYDVNNLNHPFTATARNVIYDPGFELYGPISPLTPMAPMVRTISNVTQNNISGVLLQLGFALPGLTDTLTVEDRSGQQSCWLLNTTAGTPSTPILPADDAVLLPDGQSVWSATSTSSQQLVQTLQNTTGYLLYASLLLLTTMDDASAKSFAITPLLPNYFRIQDIQKVSVFMTDVNNNSYLTEVPISGTTPTLRRGVISIPVSASSASGLLEIVFNNTTAATLRVHGQAVIADQLTIRYLVVHV